MFYYFTLQLCKLLQQFKELRVDVIQDFLNEFYAHPVLQRYYVVLAAPCELDDPLKSFLQIPIWSERVIFIQGSVLRETDLVRVKFVINYVSYSKPNFAYLNLIFYLHLLFNKYLTSYFLLCFPSCLV